MSNPQASPEGTKRSRRNFTVEDDATILKLISIVGDKEWRKISQYIPGKTTRQCRERYRLYLNPAIKNLPWTEEEDNLLNRLVSEMGCRWVEITKFFNGRSEINVKNRWYSRQRSNMNRIQLNPQVLPDFVDSTFGIDLDISMDSMMTEPFGLVSIM